jgi:hypothetical protein
LAIFAFVICLGAVLWIYKRNAKHLEDVIKEDAKSDSLLAILDNVALGTFLIGVLASSIAGFLIAAHSFSEREKSMASESKQVTPGFAFDSVNGISNLTPTQMTKSLNGIGGLNPVSSGAATSQSIATPPNATVGSGVQNKK